MTNYARSDVYPLEVEAIGDMRTCTDEAHVKGCPCGVGGDAMPRHSCWLCKRSDPIKHGTYVRVVFDGDVVDVCDDCLEKADVTESLDMGEDDDD